jgi:hypothetical protein
VSYVTMRLLLWAGAIAFGVWELAAVILWIGDAASIASAGTHTWERLSADWFLLVVVTDHLVIAAVALLWVLVDARRRGQPLWMRLAWVVAFVGLGTPALLGYLAQRASARTKCCSSR